MVEVHEASIDRRGRRPRRLQPRPALAALLEDLPAEEAETVVRRALSLVYVCDSDDLEEAHEQPA